MKLDSSMSREIGSYHNRRWLSTVLDKILVSLRLGLFMSNALFLIELWTTNGFDICVHVGYSCPFASVSDIQPSVNKIQVVFPKTGRLSASCEVTRRMQLAPVRVIWNIVDNSLTDAVLRILDGWYHLVAYLSWGLGWGWISLIRNEWFDWWHFRPDDVLR